MYLLFRYHHITPSQYHEMGFGERKVISAFMKYENQRRNEEIAKINEKRSV